MQTPAYKPMLQVRLSSQTPSQKENKTERERERQKLYIHAAISLTMALRLLMQKLGRARGDY